MSSLQGKALRTLVESRGLWCDSTCVLEAESKLDIKRRKPGILFISLQVGFACISFEIKNTKKKVVKNMLNNFSCLYDIKNSAFGNGPHKVFNQVNRRRAKLYFHFLNKQCYHKAK